MDLFSKRLGLGLALSFVAIACSAPTIPNEGLNTDETDPSQSASTKIPPKPAPTAAPSSSGTTAAPSTPPPSDTSTPPPPPPPPPTGTDCSAQTTGDACFTCCDTASGGALKVADDAFGQCACGAGGACTTACSATFCTGAQPSAACDSCLAQCDQAASAACTSAACQQGEQCLQTSGCDAKP